MYPKNFNRDQVTVFLLTYCAYVCYYISRKPLSVVKSTLIDCGGGEEEDGNNTICTSYISKRKERQSLFTTNQSYDNF